MLKYALLVLIILSCATPVAHSTLPKLNRTRSSPHSREVSEQAAASVVLEVICEDTNQLSEESENVNYGVKIGSGVIVDNRHVLTAAHVVSCPVIPTIRVSMSNGKKLRMSVVKEHDKVDLAKLEISSAEGFNLDIYPALVSAPPTGALPEPERVCVAKAYPDRGFNCGPVAGMTKVKMNDGLSSPDFKLVFNGNPGRPGNSGSGTYDEFGNLIGIFIGNIYCQDHKPECGDIVTTLADKNI